MTHYTPKVQFGLLQPSTNKGLFSQAISIGSVEWYAWLKDHHTFSFENISGTISMQKIQQEGSSYWFAYRRYRGKSCKIGMGKSEELSLERLNEGVHSLMTGHPLKPGPNQNLQHSSTRLLPRNPTITTKLHIACVPSNLVPRARLTSLIDDGVQHKLTLLIAPPGFGKTTLLSEWGISHPESELPCAWFTLDESDNDPINFLICFISALRTLQTDIGEGILTMLLSSQSSMPTITIMAELINEITSTILQDFAFFFDDYHTIKTSSIHNMITFLLDHLPLCMHIVIASRREPPLPLARLRSQRQLTQVRAGELCFVSEEMVTFFNEVMGMGLSTADVTAIAERTEGWIAGVQLAVLSLQKQKDFTIFIKEFTGSHCDVWDYFAEEVFHHQSQDVQTFLLKTSILNHLHTSLCEAVTGQDVKPTTVEKLGQAGLFLFPLDEERRWYRYHPLFRDFLYHQLYRSSPDIVYELHRRASIWFEQNKLEARAIDHAIAGQDFERAAQLIERIALTMLMQNKVAALLKWLEVLPGEQVHSRPRLCVYYAWVLVFNKMIEAVEPCLQSIEYEIGGGATNSKIAKLTDICIFIAHTEELGELQWISGQIAAIRAYIANIRGDAPLAINLAEYALECLPESNHYLRSIVTLTLGVAHSLSGNVLKASQFFRDTQTLAQASGTISMRLTAMCGLARIQVMQGQLHQGTQTYTQLLQVAAYNHSQTTKPLPAEGMAYIRMGDLFREWNELDSATHYLMKGIEICSHQEAIEIETVGVVDGYIGLARVKHAQYDKLGALTMLQYAEQYGQKYHLPAWILTSLMIERVRLCLAEKCISASTMCSHTLNISYLQEFAHVTFARVLLAQGDMEGALIQLDTVLQVALAAKRMGNVIEIQMLQALIYQRQNNILKATKVLGHVLLLAEVEGYIRLFVDEGEPMAALLEKVIAVQRRDRQAMIPHFSLNYGMKLLAALGKQEKKTVPAAERNFEDTAQSLVEPLSIRELEVLHSIADGISSSEIAMQMTVAESTIKWHIKNMYGKLNVHSRSQLIVLARKLNL